MRRTSDELMRALDHFGLAKSDPARPGLLDPEKFAQALYSAIEHDAAAAVARDKKIAAQPVPEKMVIRLDARRGRRFTHAWVTGVSYADDSRKTVYAITKFSYSDDRTRAMQFGAECGRAVARQVAGDFNMRGVTMENVSFLPMRGGGER